MPEIIRDTGSALPALMALYPKAFPSEDLRPLLQQMIGRPEVVNLLAGDADQPLGHMAMTYGTVGAQRVALLGPLAVDPDHQKAGIGTALVQAGIEAVLEGGAEQVLVLGDPDYYGRFGFQQEEAVTPPYPMPEGWAAAWQSLSLDEETPEGRLELPEFWMNAALWAE